METSASTLQSNVLKPPPNSPASATLVPLVKPLVLKQVARREMSKGAENVKMLGKHVSTLNLLEPPLRFPASALTVVKLIMTVKSNFRVWVHQSSILLF